MTDSKLSQITAGNAIVAATDKLVGVRSGTTDVLLDAPTDATLSTSDITTNNVSTSKHGFAPKAPNDATKYLDGTGAYSVPSVASVADSSVTFTDITTNNVSTTKHGFAPKLPNDATKYLDGTGAYSVPAGGGGGGGTSTGLVSAIASGNLIM